MTRVHGPDGRVWEVRRRPERPGPLGYLGIGPWLVEATTTGERRRWRSPGLAGSGRLRDDVALALRTGADGPSGEVALPADGAEAGAG
ncbi:MAG: hypothetical protein ACLFUG_03470 [Nitriliruptoraceae bacterium]